MDDIHIVVMTLPVCLQVSVIQCRGYVPEAKKRTGKTVDMFLGEICVQT